MKEKHTMYIIGGIARAGKSTIAREMAQRVSLTVLPTDSIRSAIRYTLMGDVPMSIGRVSFKGSGKYGSDQVWPFERNDQSEDDLAWLGTFALIRKYDRLNAYDVLFEGVAITPKLISQIKLENLTIKVIFIGYNNESHAESMLFHANKEKDYIYREMEESGRGDEYIKEIVRNGIKQSIEIQQQSEECGYKYFDVTASSSFEEHVRTTVDYLLKKE